MEIWLYFDSNGITQLQWEAAWNECHEVLQCFPVPLASLFYEKKWNSERRVWKTQLIRDSGDETNLSIKSDMASLEFGGTFTLYRNLAKYPASKVNQDILWISEDNIHGYSDRCRIWENDTGGAPYSLAVLALGILLENRFPTNCALYGFEYTDFHINNIRAWLSGALKTNILLPVCNDPERLWERLIPLYPSIELAMRRFFKLVKSSKRKCFEFLIAQGYGDALQNELIRTMSNFSSVAQWGVTDWLYPYLEAIKDVEQVALLVKRVHEKTGAKDFSLEILLKVLVSEGITVNPFQSEIIKEWNDTNDSLVTDMEGINRLFLRMSGLPNRINYYISTDLLIEIFGCMEPANGIKFQEIIERETQKCLENFKKLEDVTDKITEKISNNEDSEQSYLSERMACRVRRRYLPFEDYILNEVESQMREFANPLENSLIIAQKLGEIMKKYEEERQKPYKFDSREKILESLSFFSGEHGFALRETAWDVIDNEQDTDILTMLTIYASLRIQEKTSWEWRKYILETPALWPAMRDVFMKAATEVRLSYRDEADPHTLFLKDIQGVK